MNKTQKERTQKIMSIVALKIEGKLLAECMIETGLRKETIKRYLTEVAESLKEN